MAFGVTVGGYLLYCEGLALPVFDEDFYLPQGAPAWLVEKTGPFFAAGEQYTLAQAREHF